VDLGWGDNKRTLWIRCNLWGKRAEGRLVDHLAKGAQVVVSGEIDLREYEKRDGTKGHSLELRVAGIDLVGGRQAKNTAGADQTAQEPRSGRSPDPATLSPGTISMTTSHSSSHKPPVRCVSCVHARWRGWEQRLRCDRNMPMLDAWDCRYHQRYPGAEEETP